MLTVAYCRVSTEEQAAEGFSIEGQATRLRAYATAHELGSVTIVEDPGRSGKDLNRPGLQQILAMVEQGHVMHVMVWRLDRLSRNLGDLIELADLFGRKGVGLHSVNENLDLSSATGRMYFNIIGTFAQFYREQLGENVRMGTAQAVREGKWVNGELVANDDAPAVVQVFRLRALGLSHREIAERTGFKHSTVLVILRSRIYLGDVLLNGQWFPGRHEAIITEAEFAAAHRGFRKGKRHGRDLLSGHVRCGLCRRSMSITQNGQGRRLYKCAHRGTGCAQPRRSAPGLLRAALLGIRLVAADDALQAAIRAELDRARGAARQGRTRTGRAATEALERFIERRRKLLELHYEGKISSELFGEEETKLTHRIATLREEQEAEEGQALERNELLERFESVLQVLGDLDLNTIWEVATDQERRVLVNELLDHVAVFPDHLEVTVHGVPKVNVLLSEVGLTESQNGGVGGATHALSTCDPWQAWLAVA